VSLMMIIGRAYQDEWIIHTDSGDGRTDNFKEQFNREKRMKVIYNLDGSRTWVAIENMTQEQKRGYDGQINRPSQQQLDKGEMTRELRELMSSPSQYRKLQQIKGNK